MVKSKVEKTWRKGVLSLEWKREGAIDGDRDGDDSVDPTCVGQWEGERPCGWGSRKEWGTLFQRKLLQKNTHNSKRASYKSCSSSSSSFSCISIMGQLDAEQSSFLLDSMQFEGQSLAGLGQSQQLWLQIVDILQPQLLRLKHVLMLIHWSTESLSLYIFRAECHHHSISTKPHISKL